MTKEYNIREVLEPFAKAAERFDQAAVNFGTLPSDDLHKPRTDFSMGDLRRARTFLESIPADGGTVKAEEIARLIYAAMSWACGVPRPTSGIPAWLDHGNSLAQEEARSAALRVLSCLSTPSDTAATMREFSPDKGLGKVEDWAVDIHFTSTPILTYQMCSVIEGEQAYGVLALITAALFSSDTTEAMGEASYKSPTPKGSPEELGEVTRFGSVEELMDDLNRPSIEAQDEVVAWQYRYKTSAGFSRWEVTVFEAHARSMAVEGGEYRPLYARPVEFPTASRAGAGAVGDAVAWRREWQAGGYRVAEDEFTQNAELAEEWRTHPQTLAVIPLRPVEEPGEVEREREDLRAAIEAIDNRRWGRARYIIEMVLRFREEAA